MKKLFALILVILMLTACSSEGSDILTDRKKPAAEPAKSFTSSIFGRNVKYDAFTPAEGLALPIPSDEIKDMVQIEKRLYFLGNGAVHTLDIETGEAKKLFDTNAAMFATHGGMLYTYSAETSTLSEYDLSGSVTKELTIEITNVWSLYWLSVTDDYYVINCYIKEEFIEPYILIYSRETKELTLSKKTPRMEIKLYPYKGNKLLSLSQGESGDYLGIFDAESGKNEKNQMLDTEYRPAAVYCPKTDTALVYGIPPRMHRLYEYLPELNGISPVCITEYSLDDTDKIVHNRYYFDVSQDTKFFINVYENIVSAIATSDSEYRIFDYLNPPKSITFFGRGSALKDVTYQFEKDTGILIRELSTDYDKLALKLMAGDDDFDIFDPGWNYNNYVDAGACVDLKEIESLNSRISSNAAADLVASYDGKYFGVPAHIYNFDTEESYPEDGTSSCYSLMISEHLYYARNVDVAEGRYSDPNGDELYKLLKFINDNPTGNRKKMPFGEEVTILYAQMYMLNPKSQNRDNAIKFLEYMFDFYNGDIPGVVYEEDLYPELESTENCYAEWRYRVAAINPIYDARNAVHDQGGNMSNSELKKLAKETAAKVRMRMME